MSFTRLTKAALLAAVAALFVAAPAQATYTTLCHQGVTTVVHNDTVAEHIAHGDTLGECPEVPPTPEPEPVPTPEPTPEPTPVPPPPAPTPEPVPPAPKPTPIPAPEPKPEPKPNPAPNPIPNPTPNPTPEPTPKVESSTLPYTGTAPAIPALLGATVLLAGLGLRRRYQRSR